MISWQADIAALETKKSRVLMIGLISLFSVVGLSQVCYGFRCYSEYEFTWWDGEGIEHVNGFSMSHFQMKMRSFLFEESSNRVPFKEAFFLTKLHHSYQSNLTEECPHALIQANLLVSLFHGEAGSGSLAVSHYTNALSIFNRATVVHQQVSLLAWPFDLLKTEVEARVKPRLESSVNGLVLTVVIVGSANTSLPVLDMSKFVTMKLVVIGVSSVNVPEGYVFESIEYLALGVCESYLSIVQRMEPGTFLFLDLRRPLSALALNLINVFLAYVQFVNGEVDFYSFSHVRSLKQKVGHNSLPGGYVGFSFGVNKKNQSFDLLSKSNLGTELCQYTTNERISEVMWESLLRRPEKEQPSFYPLRCDDESLPWSLRLCRGDEPFKSTDWRDVLLSPVLPRKPVTLF